jgi:hypothetical protein
VSLVNELEPIIKEPLPEPIPDTSVQEDNKDAKPPKGSVQMSLDL